MRDAAGDVIDLLLAMCQRMRPEYVQVMADADGPGDAGNLAAKLAIEPVASLPKPCSNMRYVIGSYRRARLLI